MSHSWLPWTDSEIFCVVHVLPPSVDRANSMKLFAAGRREARPADVDVAGVRAVQPVVGLELDLVLEVPDRERGRRPPGDDRRELVVRHGARRTPVVPRDPDRAVGRPGAVERDPAVVQVVRAVPVLHGVARAHGEAEERRRPPLGRRVGRVAGQQAVDPARPTVAGVVEAGPRVGRRGCRAVVVRPRSHLVHVQWVDRSGWLVLLALAATRRTDRIAVAACDRRVRAAVVADVLTVGDVGVGTRRGSQRGRRERRCERKDRSSRHLPLQSFAGGSRGCLPAAGSVRTPRCKEPAEGGGLFEGWGRWVTPNIGGSARSSVALSRDSWARSRSALRARGRRRCGTRSAPRTPARRSLAARSRGATSRSSRSTCPGSRAAAASRARG